MNSTVGGPKLIDAELKITNCLVLLQRYNRDHNPAKNNNWDFLGFAYVNGIMQRELEETG